jgi:uncharacterized protein
MSTEPFAKAKCVSMSTFRRDGTPVATPVWFYADGDRLFTTTHTSAGKLKRLAHTSRIELAVCTQRGKVTGPIYVGEARVLDAAETAVVMRAKQKRYPIHKLMVRLIPSMRDQVGLEMRPGVRKDES